MVGIRNRLVSCCELCLASCLRLYRNVYVRARVHERCAGALSERERERERAAANELATPRALVAQCSERTRLGGDAMRSLLCSDQAICTRADA